jgi:hypothetical protein
MNALIVTAFWPERLAVGNEDIQQSLLDSKDRWGLA